MTDRDAFSPEIARRICDRAAAGMTIREIARRRGFSSAATIRGWLQQRPDFAEAYGLALAEAAEGGGSVGTEDYSLELAARFCARVAAGEALHELHADPGMPSWAVCQLWLDRHPEFASLLARAKEVQAQRLFDEVRQIADAARPDTLQLARLRIGARQWQAGRLGLRGSRATDTGRDPAPAAFDVEVVEF